MARIEDEMRDSTPAIHLGAADMLSGKEDWPGSTTLQFCMLLLQASALALENELLPINR